MAIRLGIYHPLAFLPRDVARARVRAVWEQHPEFSAEQVAASARVEHPLGMCRTWKLLRECRVAAAKRSPVHNRVGWHLDKFTAARIRVGAIWKRHPEFTAKQVIRRLGPNYALRPTVGPEGNEGVLAGPREPHPEVLAGWTAGVAILAGTKGLTRDLSCSPQGSRVHGPGWAQESPRRAVARRVCPAAGQSKGHYNAGKTLIRTATQGGGDVGGTSPALQLASRDPVRTRRGQQL